MEIKTRYKYINFVKVKDNPKTSVWACRNKKTGYELGEIIWYGPWRQYCFAPWHGTVFNVSCLDDIKHFIGQLR